jgi:CubicO group peptidase (beta-lactamase class C family)
VAIDQHVVARERLADLADSLMPKHPELLGISEDEGTAWLVRGDTAEIIGRNKAFVYGGREPNDSGKPFLTLYPGDRYDLGARRVLRRAITGSPLTHAFVDSLFAPLARNGTTMATVLVAQDGKVLVDRAYGVPPQAKYMPATTVPNFALGGLSAGFTATAALLAVRDGKMSLSDSIPTGTPKLAGDFVANASSAAGMTTVREYLAAGPTWPDSGKQLAQFVTERGGTPFTQFVTRRILTPIGAHKTQVGSDGQLQSNVDELYRWELGLESNRDFGADTSAATDGSTDVRQMLSRAVAWQTDSYRGVMTRYTQYGTTPGGRNAFVRIPDRKTTIIILTNSDGVNARRLANAITDRLFFRSGVGSR